jgi:hypothetical protein
MRPKHVPPFVLVLLVAALLVGVAGARLSAVAQEAASDTNPAGQHPIVGSWSLLLAAGPRVQAPSLATFDADGTLLVTDLVQGTGHGAWTATDGRSASFVFVFVRERRDGGFAGTTVFRGTAEVAADGSHWSRSTLEGEETGPLGGARGDLRLPDAPLQLRAERIAVSPPSGAATPEPGQPGQPGTTAATPVAGAAEATPVLEPADASPVADPAAATPVAVGGDAAVRIVLEPQPADGAAPRRRVEAARDVIARRLDALGDGDAVAGIDDRGWIEVRATGAVDPVRLATALSQTGLLEIVDPLGQVLAPGTVIATTLGGPDGSPGGDPVYETVVDGRDVAEAFVTADSTGRGAVEFRLRSNAADDLLRFTRRNIGQPLAVLLDKRVVSSPTIQAAVGDRGIVAGLAEQEVDAVAAQLASGPLPVPLAVAEIAPVPSSAGTPTP